MRGVISTASLGSPATMELCMKGDKKRPVLKVHVRHGDVITMCDTRLQAFAEASYPFSSSVLYPILIL